MKSVMRKKFLNVKGFTLIEIIASLVILVIVGALVIISTIKIVQGFVFTKMNAETSQKGHIALNRLTKEFTNIISVSSGGPDSITFASRSYKDIDEDGIAGDDIIQSVSWAGSGQPLFLNHLLPLPITNNILVDNVEAFALTYWVAVLDSSDPPILSWIETSATTSTEIGITLSLDGANNTNSTFTARVAPQKSVIL